MTQTLRRLEYSFRIESIVSILSEIIILIVIFVAGYCVVTTRFFKRTSKTKSKVSTSGDESKKDTTDAESENTKPHKVDYDMTAISYKDGKNQYDTNASYSITKLAIQTMYSRAYAVGVMHVSTISAIADQQTAQFHYCIPDLGDSSGKRADLVMYSFRPINGNDITPHGKIDGSGAKG